MTEFFNFLNGQSGDRLFGYCIFILIALSLLTSMVVNVVSALTKKTRIKRDHNITVKTKKDE